MKKDTILYWGTYLVLATVFTILFRWLFPNLTENLSESITGIAYADLIMLLGQFFSYGNMKLLKNHGLAINVLLVIAFEIFSMVALIVFYHFFPSASELWGFGVGMLALVVPLGVVDLLARRYKV